MNVFTTDHPMVKETSPAILRMQRRLFKCFLVLLLAYPSYLLMLGPLYALNGRGFFDLIPQPVREAFMLPAAPVYAIPGLRSSYDNYLNWWYADPNAVPPETGWW